MLGSDVMLENGVLRGQRKHGLQEQLDESDVREQSDKICLFVTYKKSR